MVDGIEPLDLTNNPATEDTESSSCASDEASETDTVRITPKKRLVVAQPSNMDKLNLIMMAMEEWFKKNGITSDFDKRGVIVEKAIDLLYAKPEIEEQLGAEKVASLMNQKVKRFF